jgi:hypothetical protein
LTLEYWTKLAEEVAHPDFLERYSALKFAVRFVAIGGFLFGVLVGLFL